MSEPVDYESEAPPAPPPPKGAMRALFFIVLSDFLGFGLIIPSLPFYARQYGSSDLQVGLMMATYSLCQLIGSPILGLISDRVGRRPVLIFSQLGSVTGYLILAAATAIGWANPLHGLLLVYISRVVDGFSGGNVSTAHAYVSDVTAPADRARAMGILGAAFGIGFSIGPGVGGMLGHFHRSLPALAAAAFSLAAAIMTIVWLREPTRHSREADDEIAMWLHPARFAPILRNRTLAQMLGISFLLMCAFVMLESVFAIFLADRFRFAELQVGMFFAFVGLVIVIVQGGLVGRLSKRFGEWNLIITGTILIAASMSIYVLVGWNRAITIVAGVVLILISCLFNATGRSICTPALSALISQNADPRRQGATFGLFHMLGSLARVIGPIIATALFTRHITGPFALAAVLVLIVATWTALLRAQRSRSVVADAISQPLAGHE